MAVAARLWTVSGGGRRADGKHGRDRQTGPEEIKVLGGHRETYLVSTQQLRGSRTVFFLRQKAWEIFLVLFTSIQLLVKIRSSLKGELRFKKRVKSQI